MDTRSISAWPTIFGQLGPAEVIALPLAVNGKGYDGVLFGICVVWINRVYGEAGIVSDV